MILKIAYKNLIGAGIRTWLNVLVTSISLFMIIFSSGMYEGMIKHAMRVSIDTEVANGAYWHPDYDPLDPISFENSHSKTPPFLKSLVNDKNALEVLVSQAAIYPDGRIMPVLMKGITLDQDILKIPTKNLSNHTSQTIPILIGKGMSEYSNLKIGDTFTLRWLDNNNVYDAMEGEIVDIMDSGNFKIDMGHIWIPLETAQNILGMDGHATYVVVKDDVNINASEWIKRDVEYLVRDMQTIIDLDRPNAIMIYILLLFLAAVGIFNAQILSIFKRTREIGTLMAIGMKRSQIVLLFTTEGALNAVLASIFGTIVFGPLLYYFSVYGVPLPIDYSDLGLIIAKRLIPIYSTLLIFSTVLIVGLIVLIVSYLPSKRISNLNPVDAIRGKITI